MLKKWWNKWKGGFTLILYKKIDVAIWEQMEELIEEKVGLNKEEWRRICNTKMSLGQFKFTNYGYITRRKLFDKQCSKKHK